MGSTNTGRFNDYPGSSKGKGQRSDGGGDGSGGSSGEDLCLKAFSTVLEEVERCEYYKNHNSLPPKGSEIRVSLDRRLEIVTDSGEIVGYLPTKFNYIASCINDGHSYYGNISSISKIPVSKIIVDIAPE